MATGTPAGMGILRCLALSFLFLSWEVGIPRCSAGPSTSRLDPLVRTYHAETSAVTAGVRTSSEGVSRNTDVPEISGHLPLETQHRRTETSIGTFVLTGTTRTRDTRSTFPETETLALTKTIPYQFKVVVTNSLETSATSDSMAISEMATAVTGSKLTKFIFDSLCTDESTEEVKMVTADISVLAHTSAEAESLTSESRASSDITTSSALEPGSMDPFKVWEAYTITGVEVTNSSVTETDTSATVPGPSGTNHSPTRGVAALPTPEISASPDSMESAHITDTTASNETMSTFSTTESGTPGTTGDVPLTTKDMTDRETPIKASTHNSPLVPVSSTQSWEETLSFYVGTSSHIEVSETVTVSTEAESTMSKVPAPLTFSATMNSPSEVVTIKNSTSSETFTTDSATGRTFSTSRDPVPSVHLITANSSQRANITMSKTTASSGPLMSTSATRRKPPTAVPSTAQTQLTTRGAADEDGGFLLLRLSVVSPEDLTDPRVTERLIRQIRHTLRAHMLPIPVSLLRVSMS